MSGIQESLYPQVLEGELLYLGTSSSCLLVTEKVYFLLLLYILPASKICYLKMQFLVPVHPGTELVCYIDIVHNFTTL